MNKIMIVEDEAVIALKLQERLTTMGYEVVDITHSGDEAVEKARSLLPDLMLLDIMIPGKLDGITVAEIVKAELDIPVIFLTAYSEDKIIERAKQTEPYGYIVKPMHNRELKATIEVALYKKDMERRLKESEIQLQKAHDELEQRVEERTRDLEKEITERKQAEEQIKTSLKEKEILLQEIHHRAKNNMQIISSLLKLQVSSSKNKKVEDALKESYGRVQAMSLVHETLYDTESMASIDFRSYISRLSKTVFQSYGISREQVELKIEAEDISFRIDQLSHIGLLINELVSNSLKYAFPENRKGEIVIRLGKIDQDEMELTVGDNGLGIPEDLDWCNTDTLGLQLVKMLAEDQLEGTLNLDRVNGTHFNIRFKLKER